MPTITVMQGLPASGKTTEARRMISQASGRLRRVSLDDLRTMLDGHDSSPPWNPEREKTTVRAQAHVVWSCIHDGYDVVVDNPHLYPKQLRELRRSVRGHSVAWKVSRLATSFAECIIRDSLRAPERIVGPDVIINLRQRYQEAHADGWRLTPQWLASDEGLED